MTPVDSLEGTSVARQHRFVRKWPAALALLGLLVSLSGCPLTPDDSSGPGDTTRFTARRNSPEGAIEWVAQAWAQKRLPEYQQVLHDEFEFFIRDDDAGEFPWMTGNSWGRTEELDIAKNMFDENFDGEEARPVDTIEFEYRIINQRNLLDGNQNVIGVEITCDADVTVLVSADTGWLSNTRFIFEVVPDPDEAGLYQVWKQREKKIL